MEDVERPIKLLLVDDEAEFLESTARALSRRGFEVTTARDGRTALRVIEHESFEVAVLDVKMPGIQGDELFRRINKRWPGIRVILLTGHGKIEQAFQTSKEGVYEYLTKPCEIEVLAHMARQAANSEMRRRLFEVAPEELEGIRLLIVDDERDFLDGLSAGLRRRGIAPATAASGAEALDLLDRQIFDVALLDLKMPGMGGIELLKRIKQSHPAIEVILLTGHPTVGTVRRAMRGGAFDYVIKPHDMTELVTKIQAAFIESRERAETERKRRVDEILEYRGD